MSPHLITDTRPLVRHPQRPWRPVEHERTRSGRFEIRAFAAPVVRELPPQARPEPVGTW